MNIDSNYKAVAIEPGDTDKARYTKILSRVSAYLAVSPDILMSTETQKAILGDDEYMPLSLDAVAFFVDGHNTEELGKYIKSQLSEMGDTPASSGNMPNATRSIELQALAIDIHKWRNAWREKEKEYNAIRKTKEYDKDDKDFIALGALTQTTFNKYDDLTHKLRPLVEETLKDGATIEITLESGNKQVISGQPEDIILCWENMQWMRYVDEKNYWRGFNWAAVIEVRVVELSQ